MVQVIEHVRSLVSRCLYALSAPRVLPAPALPFPKGTSVPAAGPLQLTVRIPAQQAAAVAEELSFRIQAILQQAVIEDASSPDRSTLVMVGLQSGGAGKSSTPGSQRLVAEETCTTLLH